MISGLVKSKFPSIRFTTTVTFARQIDMSFLIRALRCKMVHNIEVLREFLFRIFFSILYDMKYWGRLKDCNNQCVT